MTEEEAKTKQCCGPRNITMGLAAAEAASEGEDTPAHINPNCIASACMAWRAGPSDPLGPLIAVSVDGATRSRMDTFEQAELHRRSGWTIESGVASDADGYCGLAGKP